MRSSASKTERGRRVYFPELRFDGQRQKQGGHPGDDDAGQGYYVEGVRDLRWKVVKYESC